MERIDKEIRHGAELRKQVLEMRERRGYQSSNKIDLLMAYFDIILEHHNGISVLIKESLVGSSFALVRPVAETLYRALWVSACATPIQLNQLLKDDQFEFPKDMIDKVDAAYATEGFFKRIKRATWTSMCSYTHSGLLQISRRFSKDGSIGPSYSEEQIIEALRFTTSCLGFAALLFFKETGCENEASEVMSWLVPPDSSTIPGMP